MGLPLSPQTQLEIEKCTRFFDNWHRFKLEATKTPVMKTRHPVTDSLTMITGHLVGLLDGVMILTENLRPSAAEALLRGIYEGFLTTLLIGYHHGPIEARLLRSPKAVNLTREELGERFIAHGHFCAMHAIEYLSSDRAEWEAMASRNGKTREQAREVELTIRNLGLAAAKNFGFKNKTDQWHPFRGLGQIRSHLWPDDGRGIPLFPVGQFGITPEIWHQTFHNCYWLPSHQVHGSAAVHGLTGRPWWTREAPIDDTRYDDPRPCSFACNLTVWATGAFADVIGQMPLWNRTVGTT